MLTRIITGIIGIAIAACVIQLGGILFAGFALLLAGIAWYEFTRAFAKRGMSLNFITGCITLLFLWYAARVMYPELMLPIITVTVMVIFLESVLLHSRITIMDAITSLAGILYIGLPFAYMMMIRDYNLTIINTPLGGFDIGCAMIWVMFIGTWASDTFAYFVGTAVGRHKLCPSISPNKTIEGFLGSLVGTTATVAGLAVFFSLPVTELAILGFAMAIVATLGDLVESVAKRYVGIKDSGSIIPGHGGVWDRFDSVLFTAPLVYYFIVLTDVIETVLG